MVSAMVYSGIVIKGIHNGIRVRAKFKERWFGWE